MEKATGKNNRGRWLAALIEDVTVETPDRNITRTIERNVYAFRYKKDRDAFAIAANNAAGEQVVHKFDS